MKKRVLSLMLALVICLSLLPTADMAADITVKETSTIPASRDPVGIQRGWSCRNIAK